jgi:hypothetical protein
MRSQLAATAALVALSFGIAPLQAQEQPEAKEPGQRWMERSRIEPNVLIESVMSRRARLGVSVNLQARETDSIGAYIEAVTPGGPADKAGIRSGDIITKLDGKSLLSRGESGGMAPDDRSLPGLRLIELATRLEPQDTVPIELRRGKDRKTVSLVTSDEPNVTVWRGSPSERGFSFKVQPGEEPMVFGAPDMADMERSFSRVPRMEMFFGSPFADVELAPLNSDLGQYFGASEGVLVISVPKDSDLKLKGGDVVLAVDGRKPSSPSHLLRILRSYDSGESIKLDIMRNRKRETVTARLPERQGDKQELERMRVPAPRRGVERG